MKKKALRESRKNLGWSQYQLEKASGVSRNKIALHEQGYRRLSASESQAVLLALGAKGDLEFNKGGSIATDHGVSK